MTYRIGKLAAAVAASCALTLTTGAASADPDATTQSPAGAPACVIQPSDVRLVQREWSVVVRSYDTNHMRVHKRFMTYLRQTLGVIDPLRDNCPGEPARRAFALDVNIITTQIVGQSNETAALRKGARHGTQWATRMGLTKPEFRTL